MLLTERWILAHLRNQTFLGFEELNAAIRPLRDQLNEKVTRHLGTSRRALFETLDKPAMKPLPHEPYVYAEWKRCRAGLDYHVDIGRHYYSVPHQLLCQELWARITARTVESYDKYQRVAAHTRTSGNRQHSTFRDHIPANHRFRTDWTPERIRMTETNPLESGVSVDLAFVDVIGIPINCLEQLDNIAVQIARLGRFTVESRCISTLRGQMPDGEQSTQITPHNEPSIVDLQNDDRRKPGPAAFASRPPIVSINRWTAFGLRQDGETSNTARNENATEKATQPRST